MKYTNSMVVAFRVNADATAAVATAVGGYITSAKVFYRLIYIFFFVHSRVRLHLSLKTEDPFHCDACYVWCSVCVVYVFE